MIGSQPVGEGAQGEEEPLRLDQARGALAVDALRLAQVHGLVGQAARLAGEPAGALSAVRATPDDVPIEQDGVAAPEAVDLAGFQVAARVELEEGLRDRGFVGLVEGGTHQRVGSRVEGLERCEDALGVVIRGLQDGSLVDLGFELDVALVIVGQANPMRRQSPQAIEALEHVGHYVGTAQVP